jgi:hypothetical protein
MTVWTEKLDMSTIPDEVLFSEIGRRRVAKRDPKNAGPPRVLRPCEWCGKEFGAREMRRHIPHCPKRR